jgi:redox-sensing transcriptional repressor
VGQLGGALLSYKGFEECGLNIVAGFDSHPSIEGMEVNGRVVYPDQMMGEIARLYKVEIGIITVGSESAQAVCNMMIEAGIKAIWNFAPVHLTVPDNIVIRNENLAASLALLSKQLDE